MWNELRCPKAPTDLLWRESESPIQVATVATRVADSPVTCGDDLTLGLLVDSPGAPRGLWTGRAGPSPGMPSDEPCWPARRVSTQSRCHVPTVAPSPRSGDNIGDKIADKRVKADTR